MKKYLALFFILTVFLCSTAVFAYKLDPTIENLNMSGFLRFRYWYTTSKNKVPDTFPASDNYESVNFSDFFFRNRFDLTILHNLEIKAVFDIIGTMGKAGTGFELGNGTTNLVTRDVYAVFRPTGSSELEIGLQPFSLPGGYILARDGSGIKYQHTLLNRKLLLHAGIVKAYDDADDSFGENTTPPEYADDNIYFLSATLNIIALITSDLYFVYEYDRYTSDEDTRKARLSWIGLHTNLVSGNWILRLGGIYNWGKIKLHGGIGNFFRERIKAGLGEFEFGYKFSNLQCSIAAEGATGDPNNANDSTSFQDIKASHNFSLIVVDNSGGISLRGSGESSWYGLYGIGLKLSYTLLNSILVSLKPSHFETTKSVEWLGESSTYFGDELDIQFDYTYQDAVSLFLATGVFVPGNAYFALNTVQDDTGGVIAETMLGATITY